MLFLLLLLVACSVVCLVGWEVGWLNGWLAGLLSFSFTPPHIHVFLHNKDDDHYNDYYALEECCLCALLAG